jgi:hypothetical protein
VVEFFIGGFATLIHAVDLCLAGTSGGCLWFTLTSPGDEATHSDDDMNK